MKKKKKLSVPGSSKQAKVATAKKETKEFNPKLELIQKLIPIALKHLEEILEDEVARLVGPRYSHNEENHRYKRWGKQQGSVYLAGQKVSLLVPRVRDVKNKREVQLSSYRQLQESNSTDEQLFIKIMHGLSCQKYENASRLIPEAFGLSRSTVSRRFIRASAKKAR